MANVDTNCARKGQILFWRKKTHSDCTKKFSESDVINMLVFLIDTIFAIFGWRVFQQTVSQLRVGNTCVEGQKSNVLMLLQEERDLDCMYSNRSLEVFRIHIWFTSHFLFLYNLQIMSCRARHLTLHPLISFNILKTVNEGLD